MTVYTNGDDNNDSLEEAHLPSPSRLSSFSAIAIVDCGGKKAVLVK